MMTGTPRQSIRLEEVLAFARDNTPYLKAVKTCDFGGKLIHPQKLVFEERVRMSCFNCGKYKANWRCPGNMPKNIDYKKVVKEYKRGAFIYVKIPFDRDNYEDVRSESSTILHRALLSMEKYMYEHDKPLVLTFIGGSCKLCKICGKDKCNNPSMARSPLESTGCNIVKSAKKYGIDISFPPKEFMMRLGLILW